MYTMFRAHNAGTASYCCEDFAKAVAKFESFAEEYPIAFLDGLKDDEWICIYYSEHEFIFLTQDGKDFIANTCK